jgi:ATP-binding cassette subfamily F protein 3
MTGLTRQDAQRLLGRFLFSGWEAHTKQVTVLSGGERRRLALAVLVASGSNFLLLDEPTNHLDLESREALEGALEAFPGTVLLVSHDRALLDAIAHRTAAVEDGTVRVHEGGWADYVQRREEHEAPPEPRPKPRAQKEPPGKPPERGPDPVAEVEAQIQARERLITELEGKLAADWSDVDTIAAHRRARSELDRLLARWEELVGELPG